MLLNFWRNNLDLAWNSFIAILVSISKTDIKILQLHNSEGRSKIKRRTDYGGNYRGKTSFSLVKCRLSKGRRTDPFDGGRNRLF